LISEITCCILKCVQELDTLIDTERGNGGGRAFPLLVTLSISVGREEDGGRGKT